MVLWPKDPTIQLLWAHVVLWWMLANYLTWEDTVVSKTEALQSHLSRREELGRVALRVLLVVFLIVATVKSAIHIVGLSATVLVLGSLLPAGRTWAAKLRHLAEWEVGINVLFLLVTVVQLSTDATQSIAVRTLITLSIPERHLTAISILAASIVFLGRGATFVVRGVLEQAGTLPEFAPEAKQSAMSFAVTLKYRPPSDDWRMSGQTRPAKGEHIIHELGNSKLETSDEKEEPASSIQLDRREVGRGRMIGNVERFILLLLAIMASYPAVGFLMAAKGFVRAKEFENRNYAEYFLIGTLVSTALALVVGTLLRLGFSDVWTK